MRKYFQLIGDNGRIENVKVLNESGRYYENMGQYPSGFNSQAEIFLSIYKNHETSNVILHRKYDAPFDGYIIFNANFDKNGQMVYGKLPPDGLTFERNHCNARKIYRDKKIDLPVSGNDKLWECAGRDLISGNSRTFTNDDSTKGAFEIFIELARLKTSINK